MPFTRTESYTPKEPSCGNLNGIKYQKHPGAHFRTPLSINKTIKLFTTTRFSSLTETNATIMVENNKKRI